MGCFILKGKIITLSIGKPKVFQWKKKPEESGIAKAIVEEVQLNKPALKAMGLLMRSFTADQIVLFVHILLNTTNIGEKFFKSHLLHHHLEKIYV